MSETATIEQMTKIELRQECKRRGIAYSGNDSKGDLVAKLGTQIREVGERLGGQAKVVAEAIAPVGPSAEVVAEAVAQLQKEMESPEFAEAMVRVDEILDEAVAAQDRVERTRLAIEESKILKAWRKGGATPPKPETPNLDAINAEAAGEKPAAAARAVRVVTSSTTLPSGALAPGALTLAVREYVGAHPQETTPGAVARALGRSAGAVTNAMQKLTTEGCLVRTSDKPLRFQAA